MIQNFKHWCITLRYQPGHTLFGIGVLCAAIGLIMAAIDINGPWMLPMLVSIVLMLPIIAWTHCSVRNLNQNFAIYPSMPILDGSRYYYIAERVRDDVKSSSCRQIVADGLRSVPDLLDALPPGRYVTITHDAVVRRISRCPHLKMDGAIIDAGQIDLQAILQKQTKGRCRHCKSRCAAWGAPARQFYVVAFTSTKKEDGNGLQESIR